MFSINFIIYNADVTERELSNLQFCLAKSFLGQGLRSLNEEVYPRSVWDLECELRTLIYIFT